MCLGCGACAYVCSNKNITLENIYADGIRPRLGSENCNQRRECVQVCPGCAVNQSPPSNEVIESLTNGWGPIIELWEGHAVDLEIRYKGSSGGLASALALFLIERGETHGVLHIAADTERPYLNKTVLSSNREEILARTGSRYAPASPCDHLELIENAPGRCVFIGKPCDVAGLRKAQSLRPQLDEKVGVAIGIFCAGTPSTQGSLDLMERLGVDLQNVEQLRYRGEGWPGNFTVRSKGSSNVTKSLSYQESWGFVQKYRPWRCQLCPDGTSEFADISCGDPWYRETGDDPGRSLVLVRTQRGRQILHGAIKAGYVQLERVAPEVLELSQINLLMKRTAIWGRLLTMKAFGLPVPRYEGFPLFENWLELPVKEKVKSIVGTARRIVQRKYYKPVEISEG